MISMDKSEIYGKVVTDISFFEAANKYKLYIYRQNAWTHAYKKNGENIEKSIKQKHVDFLDFQIFAHGCHIIVSIVLKVTLLYLFSSISLISINLI